MAADMPLKAQYQAYIKQLNAQKTSDDDLAAFVHDSVTHNARQLTRSEYGAMIAASITGAPDLYFDVHTLVVDETQVASRIHFDCTPVSEFVGRQPTGGKVAFYEHVFYRFEEGRIREVWSFLDEPALTAQMGAPKAGY
ncbi:hypothetical protein C8R43DRAFT_587643 [Mycena crocata]|nr:hypothetical protein C8R43DRAFT_587643 [Mycena crocata]